MPDSVKRLHSCGYSMERAWAVYFSFLKTLDFDGLSEFVAALEGAHFHHVPVV